MESKQYKNNRWRRRFNKVDEVNFAVPQANATHQRMKDSAWIGILAFSLTVIAGRLLLPIPDGANHPSYLPLVVVSCIIAFTVLFPSRSPRFIRVLDWVIGPSFWVGFTCALVVAISAYGAERRALTFGVFLLFGMSHYTIFRGAFWPTVFSAFASSLVYLVMARGYGFFSDAAFAQVAILFGAMHVFGVGACFFAERHERLLYLTSIELEYQKTRAEALLHNILPVSIAPRIRVGTDTVADSHAAASVIFIDLVGFTRLAESMSPARLVDILRELFLAYDGLAEKHGVEKIKTIGDAYMAAAGVPIPCEDHAARCAAFALDVRAATDAYRARSGLSLHVRIGIHSGPLVAGVIGGKKMIYDVWGTTVNVASRMESQGQVDEIQVTAETRELLGASFRFSGGHSVNVKGLGEMRAYLLQPRVAVESPIAA